MPPKRRSDAISRDDPPSSPDAESDSDSETVTQSRRQRPRSSSESSAASSASDSHHHDPHGTLVKKLVRLALATEYSRTPLRRSDIHTKIFKDSNTHGRSFKTIFNSAQDILKDTFGMHLVELPSKEKTSLKDRRNQATQTKSNTSTSSKSWILVSVLPDKLKTNPAVVQPTKAPSQETEATYTALYTFILSLIYLNNGALTDQKLNRYLKRVNMDTYTPFGALEKLLARMAREGYVEKRRDTTSGEEVIEWVSGPRGKVEVGAKGVAGLVRSVYGYGAVPLGMVAGATATQPGRSRRGSGSGSDDEGDSGPQRLVKIEEDELNSKIKRSLGIRFGRERQRGDDEDDSAGAGAGDSGTEQAIMPPPTRTSRTQTQQQTRSRRTRRQDADDD
ncbi:hypothetical protein PV08_05455 [Exophiala spinifera]|uniref:MAGE domain-containing protein n=1 Tax=Exophiala spinifera TaxID=91928 RepID=A0A0D2BVV2_9EURO|nr:uncharacterized protein PV08_05455 [Exophiala spinifera]KIW15409.1 hypothetical protein PV08_05455 [Exophiala spinifera]